MMNNNPANNLLAKNYTNGWSEWSRFVLKELERLNDCYENLDKKMDTISVDIAMLKVKAGVWGAVGGLIPVAIMVAWVLLKK